MSVFKESESNTDINALFFITISTSVTPPMYFDYINIIVFTITLCALHVMNKYIRNIIFKDFLNKNVSSKTLYTHLLQLINLALYS